MLASVVALATGGCNVDFGYLLPAAAGQIKLIQKLVPIEDAINDGSLTDEQIRKLRLIQDVRQYAGDVMGLSIDNHYTQFYDAGNEPVAINVSASRKDALAPMLWTFPLVGTVPYLGYFDPDAATARTDELRAQNLDVFTYEIDAYSALGFLPNPVLSPMLERGDTSLVDTVIHELLHATVWRVSDTPFNESLATFFGRRGAEMYFADRYPDQPERIDDATAQFADVDRFTAFMLELVQELDAYYQSDLPSDAKILGRESIIRQAGQRFDDEVLPLMNNPDRYTWVRDMPVNNAWLLGIRRYNLEIDVFEQVLQATGNDWPASINLFRQAANSDQPYDFLRTWLADGSPAEGAKTVRDTATDSPPNASTNAVSPAHTGPCDLHRTTTIVHVP